MPGKQKNGKELRERRGETFTASSCKLKRSSISILLVEVVSYLVHALSQLYCTPYITELYLIENSLSNSQYQVTQRKCQLLELCGTIEHLQWSQLLKSGKKQNPLVQRSLPNHLTKLNCVPFENPQSNCQVTKIIQRRERS